MEQSMPQTPQTLPLIPGAIDLARQGETQIGLGGRVSTNTYQEMFAKLIGRYVICDFLIGTNLFHTRDGILTAVGQSYFQLYDPRTGGTTSCDIYSLKFTTFFPAGTDISSIMNMAPAQRNAIVHQMATNPQGRMQVISGSENMSGMSLYPNSSPYMGQSNMPMGTAMPNTQYTPRYPQMGGDQPQQMPYDQWRQQLTDGGSVPVMVILD